MAGTITALVAQERNKERVNVYLDGDFAFGLALIEALHLKKGQHLSDEEIARLKALDEIEVMRERALHFLSFRPRSSGELRAHLRQKDASEAAIEAVLERLQNAGLIDDAEFARYWAQNREQFKPRGARALAQELRQKGVDDELIAEATSQLDEAESAYRAAKSRVARLANLDKQLFRKRLGDFLLRRGFDYNTIRSVVDRLWEEQQENIDDAETAHHPDFDQEDTDT